MERPKVQIWSRFDCISTIMPYYAQTHRVFLLLSTLCSDTRSKLDEYYEEFINLMRDNWKWLRIASKDTWKYILYPNDLFEFSICAINDYNFDCFVRYVKELTDQKGWHFNAHFMHSKIKISKSIEIDPSIIKKLYPYDESLKSIKICCKDFCRNPAGD